MKRLFLAVLILVITQVAAPRGASEPPSTAPALLGAPHSWVAQWQSTGGRIGRPEVAGSNPALGARGAPLSGTATWYCGRGSACTRGYSGSDLVAAIDPSLGIKRGTLVTVSHGGHSVLVRVVDVCACSGARLIDLTSGAFSRLAPLSRGVIRVTLTVGTRLPNTYTEGGTP